MKTARHVIEGVWCAAVIALGVPFYYALKALGDPYIRELDAKQREREAERARLAEIASRNPAWAVRK